MMNILQPKSDFLFISDSLKLILGSTVALILPILASPIITRLYDPDAFGIFALFTSFTTIFTVIACMRYELAIMLPKDDQSAVNILGVSILFSVFNSILITLIIQLIEKPLLLLVKAPEMDPYMWMIAPMVFINGSFLALTYWSTRIKKFKHISYSKITGSAASTSTQILAGLIGYANGGILVFSNILGSAISALFLLGTLQQNNGKIIKESIKFNKMALELKRYKNFLIYDSWAALLNSISWQIPTLLISTFFSTNIVGYYALCMMVLLFPINLIGGSISQVFFQFAVEAKFKGKLAIITEDIIIYLIMIGIFPTILLMNTGRETFIAIFGLNWSESGIFAQIFALWVFFVFIGSPINTLFSVLELQRSFLLFNVLYFLIRSGAIIIGGQINDARITMLLFSVGGLIIYIISYLWLIRKVGCSMHRIFNRSLRCILYSILLLFAFISIKSILSLDPQQVLLGEIVIILVYYISNIKNDKKIMEYLRSYSIER